MTLDSCTEPVTLSPDDCREVNRWWTITRSVTNMAHDLNNVLQLISGNVEMLQRRSDLDPDVHRRLTSIAAQSVRAIATMTPLIDYARESSSTLDRLDLRALAPLALSLRSVSLGRGGVRSSVAPSIGGDLVVRVSSTMGLQLMLNLLLRAERQVYGRAAAELTVTLERTGDDVVTVVNASCQGGAGEVGSEPTVAERIADCATADLARSCGAALKVEQSLHHLRLTLSMAADSRGVQAADAVPPSR